VLKAMRAVQTNMDQRNGKSELAQVPVLRAADCDLGDNRVLEDSESTWSIGLWSTGNLHERRESGATTSSLAAEQGTGFEKSKADL
jgi:hypothetical protein